MAKSPDSVPRYEDLPTALPVFPLAGVLLLPGGRLPLNIFEPRYKAMLHDALAADGLIGMIQPVSADAGDAEPALYPTGCAGIVSSLSPTDDGRFLLTLDGVARFNVASELEQRSGYRRVKPDWTPWRGDMTPESNIGFDRERLLGALRACFEAWGAGVTNWESIRNMDDARLVNSIAMHGLFEAPEKQALLLARDTSQRAEIMTAMLEMATPPATGAENVRH